MDKKVLEYFDNNIMKLLKNQHYNILNNMSIMILGSVGLEIDDKYSDLEAVIYLPQKIWKEHGALLQLNLNKCLIETNIWKSEGSIISVHPFSWMLDGQGEKVLNNSENILWEEISIESLFTIQNNKIYFDPQETLNKIRMATTSEKMPNSYFKKLLLVCLKDFIETSFFDLQKSIKRNKLIEANIHFGRAVENLLQIGFYVCKQYFPWRTHLTWAYSKLPLPISKLLTNFNLLSTTIDWENKINILEFIYNSYKEYIISNQIFPEIDLNKVDIHSNDSFNELIWAERLEAWTNPNWRDFIQDKEQKALKNGYSSDQFWIWSLWGDDAENLKSRKLEC